MKDDCFVATGAPQDLCLSTGKLTRRIVFAHGGPLRIHVVVAAAAVHLRGSSSLKFLSHDRPETGLFVCKKPLVAVLLCIPGNGQDVDTLLASAAISPIPKFSPACAQLWSPS